MQSFRWDRRAIVVLIVCFGALLFSVFSTLRDQASVVHRARHVRNQLALFLISEELEHEVQRERGLSVTLRAEPENQAFQEKVARQRNQTDATYESVMQTLRQLDMGQADKLGFHYRSMLDQSRKSVDENATPESTLAVYTAIVNMCQDVRASRLNQLNGEEAIVATAYQSLSILEESAGKERALISAAIAEQALSQERLLQLAELAGGENTHLDFSISLLDSDSRSRLIETIHCAEFQQAEQIRNQLLESGQVPADLAADQWWNLQSQKILKVHQFQAHLAEKIQAKLDHSITVANRNWWIAALLAAFPVLMLCAVAYTHRSSQKSLAKSLQQSEKREALLLQECHEAVFTLIGNQIIDCNQQMLDLFGFQEKSELVQCSLFRLCRTSADPQKLNDKWQQQQEKVTTEGHARFECEFQDCNGNVILGEVMLSCLEELPQGTKILGMIYDVGERRRLERQLAESRKLESIGQLSAGIAHEINTPLQCVISNIEFIQFGIERILKQADEVRHLAEDLPTADLVAKMNEMEKKTKFQKTRDAVIEATEESATASRRIVDIVRAMKTMSYQGSVEKQPCDLNRLIRDAATISASRWKNVARMDLQLDERLEQIDANPTQISQVLLNLIVNAGDAIGEKLGTDPEELGKIEIETRWEQDCVTLRFSDTGCGIPEAKLYQVFDPFFTTKDVGKGTGQGLTIVYDVITHQHQGSIQIESKVGEGTEFLIQLPVRAPDGETGDGCLRVSASVDGT